MKKLAMLFFSAFMMTTLLSCGQQQRKPMVQKQKKDLSKYSVATFASGCFWCVEGAFESVTGVEEAISGYAGGREPNPTYKQVSAHTTNHAETVQVYYDSTMIDYPTLLKVYFASQNPTQVNGQGPDHGASYRSVIFYRNPQEKMAAEQAKAAVQKNYTEPVAAEIIPFEKFWEAEDYHQDYIQHNPDVPYVRMESIPRIKRFQKQHPELLKPGRKL